MGRVVVRKPKVIVCDLEGTITSVRFWSAILAPFIEENIEDCLKTWWSRPETVDTIEVFRRKVREDIDNGDSDCPPVADSNASTREIIESVVRAVRYHMDARRHFEELKAMQLLVWLYGCQHDLIQYHVYKDVVDAFKSWTELGLKVITFSNGIVAAQKLGLMCSLYGNLTQYIDVYLDTGGIGNKNEPDSYKNIVKLCKCKPSEVIYLSDTISELVAAKAAGMTSICVVRGHNVHLNHAEHNLKWLSRLDELEFK